MTQKVLIAIVLLFSLLTSCARSERVLELQESTELLTHPYPMNYPSTNPRPNAVLKILKPQRVTILSDKYEKDFHVYKVRDSENTEGFVLDRSGVREVHRGGS